MPRQTAHIYGSCARTESIRSLAPEFPFPVAPRGYCVGTRVLQAVLPEHHGPTVEVPVAMDDAGLDERDGIEAKTIVLEQLRAALAILREHRPDRITTLGGECSVSLAPFSHLLSRYGDDLAILWVDSHPDMGTGTTAYPGFHAMVVSALTGHGDRRGRAHHRRVHPSPSDARPTARRISPPHATWGRPLGLVVCRLTAG
ncbi:MAG TPA: arginase family protein [Lapillicoccus sp.]